MMTSYQNGVQIALYIANREDSASWNAALAYPISPGIQPHTLEWTAGITAVLFGVSLEN